MLSVLAVVLSVTVLTNAAEVDIGAGPADYLRIARGSRSVARDDARAEVQCPEDYTILQCECESFENDPDGCDGATIVNDIEGEKCVAFNGANGKGVVAKASCGFVMLTVMTEFKDNPKLRCPANYRLISCALHAHLYHQYQELRKVPTVKKDGGMCKLRHGDGCDSCKLTARCIRNIHFFG